MGRLSALIVATGLALVGTAAVAQGPAGCGGQDAPCVLEQGAYHIAVPDRSGAEPLPVVMFLHGYGGSGTQMLNNRALVDGLTARGYAVIAPQGRRRDADGPRSWGFGPFDSGRDEGAFFADVLADAAERFGTSTRQTVLGGFSAGAFMVHYLACAEPDSFAAYAPVSGVFWRPQPQTCAGPARVMQTHGWRDTVVPLEGRPLGGGRYQQGDVFAALELWRVTNGCNSHAPDRIWSHDQVLRRSWRCGGGGDIDLLLFDGGHQVPAGWANWMADWFETDPQDS